MTSLDEVYPPLRLLFERSGDYRYVLQAIGESPEDPPEWALDVCVQVHEENQIAVESQRKRGRPPKYSKEDGRLLVRVAELISDGMSKTAAVKQITGEDVDGTNFKRLMRIWNRSLRPKRMFPAAGPRGKTNKWLDYVSRKRTEERNRRLFEQALKELDEGNLDTTLDEEAEQRRMARAQWFTVAPESEEPGPSSGQVYIAPMPTDEVMVKLLKRAILRRRNGIPDDEPSVPAVNLLDSEQ